MKEEAILVFMKARSVPYSLRSKVKSKLNQQEQKSESVIMAVTWSEWAMPIVVVPKMVSTVRLCRDFRMAVNKALKFDKYLLPRVEDMLATFGGNTIFSKVDLRHLYTDGQPVAHFWSCFSTSHLAANDGTSSENTMFAG